MDTNDYGTYHTGFLITHLDMNLESIEKTKRTACQYIELMKFNECFLNELQANNTDSYILESLAEKMEEYIKPYREANEQISTFMHEYIHYLQDITTLVGITCLTLYSKIIQELMSGLSSKMDSEKILLPYRTGWNDKSNQMDYLLRFFSCNKDQKEYKRLHNYISLELDDDIMFPTLSKENPKIFSKELIKEFHNIKINCNDNTISYDLGASIISESMAYLFESIMFQCKSRVNEYPYNICEMIIEKECPSIEGKKLIIHAICELSLMHVHSGEMFYKIIQEIKDETLSFNNIDEFEKYFLPKTEHLLKAFRDAVESSCSDIDFLYPTEIDNTSKINKHLKQCLEKGVSFREEKGLFISKAVESMNKNGETNSWFECLGLPLMIDKSYSVFSASDTDLLEVLCPKALEVLFFEEEKKCFLYDVCCNQRERNSCFSEKTCKETPWLQINNDELCPLAMYLHHRNIATSNFSK